MKLKSFIHHIKYLPTGELFAEQRDYWHTPYRFNGKELDEETGYCTNCNNKTEQTVLLFYNGKCRWLKCLEQSSPDDIGVKMLGHDHNHPNGTVEPSRGDMRFARKNQNRNPHFETHIYTRQSGNFHHYDKDGLIGVMSGK